MNEMFDEEKMFLKPKIYSFHSTKFIHYFEFQTNVTGEL